MATGEYPIDQSTPVRLGLLLSLVGALLSLAAAAGAAHYRLGAAEKRQEAAESQAEVARQIDGNHETRLRLLEDAIQRQQRTLERIEEKIDRAARSSRGGR